MKIKIRQFHNKKKGLTITCTNIGRDATWNEHSATYDTPVDGNTASELICESGWETGEVLTIEI